MQCESDIPALGPILGRSLKARFGVEVKQVAAMIEAPESEVLGILTGARPVRSEIALKLEKVFGVDAMRIMAIQAEHDLLRTKAQPEVAWKLARLARAPKHD